MMNDTCIQEGILSYLTTLSKEKPEDYRSFAGLIFSQFLNYSLSIAQTPAYIKELIDAGKIDSEKRVLTSLDDVAETLHGIIGPITEHHLKQFISYKSKKPYSNSAMRKAVEKANAL